LGRLAAKATCGCAFLSHFQIGSAFGDLGFDLRLLAPIDYPIVAAGTCTWWELRFRDRQWEPHHQHWKGSQQICGAGGPEVGCLPRRTDVVEAVVFVNGPCGTLNRSHVRYKGSRIHSFQLTVFGKSETLDCGARVMSFAFLCSVI
jgi:hypothetical protein